MSLIKCSECGKKISDKAEKCIKCGAPIEPINEKAEKNVEVDEELNNLRNYIKKDKKIVIIVFAVIALVIVGIGVSKIKDKQQEKADYLKYEKIWMEKFDGFYRNTGTSPVHLTLHKDGTSALCYGSSCTYPRFKYAYPSKLEFSGDNNYYTYCEKVCGYPDLTDRLVDGLKCYLPDGRSHFVAKMASISYNDYIMCE